MRSYASKSPDALSCASIDMLSFWADNFPKLPIQIRSPDSLLRRSIQSQTVVRNHARVGQLRSAYLPTENQFMNHGNLCRLHAVSVGGGKTDLLNG